MFKPENKIIIVDDIQEHLATLSKPFHDNGIGCKCFLYDVDYNEPLKNVRIAFFDIRINPAGGGSKGQRLNDIANAIKQYIHVDNGPFALIFWTSNKHEIDEIKQHINERHSDCPKPFLVDFIDKDEFLHRPENLTSKTKEFKENFERVFSKIAVSSIGFTHAKSNPDGAIYEALLPILQYHFLKVSNTTSIWKNVLKTLTDANSRADIPQINGFKESILNTIFHVDLSSNVHPITRGAVLEYKFFPRNVSRYNYFAKLNEESENLFSKFIQFSEAATPQEKDDYISKSKWIAIEISSACDFSQNKARNNKYVLALFAPAIDLSKIATNRLGESVFWKDIPTLFYNNDDYCIWINFNFSFSDFETNTCIGEPLFLLKKELMDLIGNRYASHISRIGITSF
jgi:hypothetical protein